MLQSLQSLEQQAAQFVSETWGPRVKGTTWIGCAVAVLRGALRWQQVLWLVLVLVLVRESHLLVLDRYVIENG